MRDVLSESRMCNVALEFMWRPAPLSVCREAASGRHI